MMKYFLALSLLGFGFIASKSLADAVKSDVVERVVAIVNDDIITLSDVDKYAARIRSGGLTDDLLIPDDATKQALLKDRSALLEKMIDEKVIDSEVKKQNLSVPIERVEQEIRTVAKRNNVSRDELKAALKERGIEFSAYQDFIKKGLERQGLVEKGITSKIKISEDDVTTAFAAKFGQSNDQAYEYTLSHIYFRSIAKGPAIAKANAERAEKRLQSGEGFEQVGAAEDPGFEEGGHLGVFKTGELQKDLDAVVQKMSAGQVSGVLPTAGGFHIVRVDRKAIIPDPRTESAREKIRNELYEKSFKRQLQAWLEQLRLDSFVRINSK
jgi:peptidyl-prolyl cis-trans isomerase SurA